jgi:hypothetical protein
MIRVLTEEIGLMSAAELRGQPRRGRCFHVIERAGSKIHNLRETCILVPSPSPDRADHHAVNKEGPLISAPHTDGWVIGPPVAGHVEGLDNLETLDTLLAQTSIIEGLSGIKVAGVREKGLH